MTRTLTALICASALVGLAACSDSGETTQALPDRPDDKLIQGTGQPEAVSRDPTPDATKGGEIPGYPASGTTGTDGGKAQQPAN